MPPTIISARITPMPKSFTDPMPEVWVRFSGSSKEVKLFSYFPDEVSFTPEEFVGKTEQEVRKLFAKKDLSYLRS